MERGLPPHVVANQLGHTDGGALARPPVGAWDGRPGAPLLRRMGRNGGADVTGLPWKATYFVRDVTRVPVLSLRAYAREGGVSRPRRAPADRPGCNEV